MVGTTKVDDIISALSLVKHVEGGCFRETYRSKGNVSTDRKGGERSTMTSIFYLLTKEYPICLPVINKSDHVHYFHDGSPLTYFVIDEEGHMHTAKLGLDVSKGEVPQFVVPGGCVKAAVLESGEYALLGEAVAPGFDYQDMRQLGADEVQSLFPELWKKVSKYMSGS
ncbi:hypothetical protein BSKO_11519 [Bryopsis sp. KO-2023]|nr:hypothetical protein BSKO_11519 [Bryopsis sp. KO-2023]